MVRVDRTTGAITGAAAIAPFDQSGPLTPVRGTLAAVPPAQLHLAVDRAATGARLAALVPPMTDNFQAFAQLSIAPGAAVGLADGIPLQFLPVTGDTLSLPYGDPFAARGWPAVVRVFANASRETPPIMGARKRMIASVSTLSLASAPAGPVAGLPTGVMLNGQPLTADLTSTAPGPVTITFTTDRPGDDTLYTLTLFSTIGMAGAETAVVEMTSVEPRFVIPAETFLGPGNPPWYYARVAVIRGGHHAAADGDLQTFDLPISIATVDTPVFVRP